MLQFRNRVCPTYVFIYLSFVTNKYMNEQTFGSFHNKIYCIWNKCFNVYFGWYIQASAVCLHDSKYYWNMCLSIMIVFVGLNMSRKTKMCSQAFCDDTSPCHDDKRWFKMIEIKKVLTHLYMIYLSNLILLDDSI